MFVLPQYIKVRKFIFEFANKWKQLISIFFVPSLERFHKISNRWLVSYLSFHSDAYNRTVVGLRPVKCQDQGWRSVSRCEVCGATLEWRVV